MGLCPTEESRSPPLRTREPDALWTGQRCEEGGKEGGPREVRTMTKAGSVPGSLCPPDPLGKKCFLALHQGIHF